MTDAVLRIHPTINFARVGGSADAYYVAPETAAGTKVDPASGLMGGLPIREGTEDTPVEAGDLRDGDRRLARQAARFRIFAYPAEGEDEAYPNGGGEEIRIGSRVGERTVKDVVWTVHVANKKANFYAISTPVKGKCVERRPDGTCAKREPLRDADGGFVHCETYGPDGGCPAGDCSVKQELGIDAYRDGRLPPARNFRRGAGLDAPERLKTLVIDPGPRALASSSDGAETLHFSRASPPTWAGPDGTVHTADGYPVSFPDDHFETDGPQGAIDTLGEVTIEEGTGRLLVLGGHGRAVSILEGGEPAPLLDAIDNDSWFDDTSDGPVTAVVVFDDGSTAEAHGAWVVTTDPGYAPQTRNVVSVWDDVFTTWVEGLGLVPELFRDGAYQASFAPSFDDDVMPIFHAAALQQWTTNLPSRGVGGHRLMASITPATDPTRVIPDLDALIRDPHDDAQAGAGVRMPLSLGDAQKSFLVLTPTQHFFLKQWHAGRASGEAPAPGAGERLDRAVLENCLGGRYSPGIDLTFIVRQPELWVRGWKAEGCGPFRVARRPLDYGAAKGGAPFLGVGWVPLRDSPGAEPGDLSKFMALPWHTDYNSCATHTPDPNPRGNNTLYWSWPAQRPVNVYPAHHCTWDADAQRWYLGGQVYSVRGDEGAGTSTPYPQQQGRFQCYIDFVKSWEKVGMVIQGLRIPAPHGDSYGAENFLEVESLFDGDGDVVQPWPTAEVPGYDAPPGCGPPATPC